MTLMQSIILGVMQGLTEFLPVSSDGHLAVASIVFGLQADPGSQLGFDVLLHAGSLLALLLCYARTWKRLLLAPLRGNAEDTRLLLLILLSTVPAAVAGLLLEDQIANTLRTVAAAAIGFLVTASMLVLGEFWGRGATGDAKRWTVPEVILISLAQALAILPGVSRSGLTIATGRILQFPRRSAADFSFLMAAPIIAGAVLLVGRDVLSGTVVLPPFPISVAGFLSSLLTSIIAIRLLLRFVRSWSLAWFALYLVPLGILLLLMQP